MIRKFYVFILVLFSQTLYAGPLSLQQVMENAKHSFPAIRVAQEQVDIAKGNYLSSFGRFDPTLSSSLDTTPKGGYENIVSDTQLSIPINNTGLKVFANYRIGRGDWPIYYKNNLTNDAGESSFGLVMPLLRDFLIDEKRAKIRSNKLQIAIAKLALQKTRIDTLSKAGRAYWMWVAAAHRIALIEDLLELAKTRQTALKKRQGLGDAPDIHLVENKRFILQRQAELIQAKLNYQQAAYTLSLYYRDKSGNPIIPKRHQVPRQLPALRMVNSPRVWRRKKPSIIAQHPSVNTLEELIIIKKIALDLSRNHLKPTLDAKAAMKKEHGADADPRLRERSYQIGLHFELPLWRREAKGEILVAKHQLLQLQHKNALVRQKLGVLYTNILNELIADKKQADLLHREVILAKKVQRAESIRFNEGDSSLFLVNQREQTTFALRLQALKLRINFLLSRLNLRGLCAFQRYC